MESNSYIIRFVCILTIVVAGLLAILIELTAEASAKNEDIFNKRAVLSAVVDKMDPEKSIDDYADDEILDIFDRQVQQTVIKMDGTPVVDMKAEEVKMEKEKKKPENERVFPLFNFQNNEEQYYILAVRGSGLWDEIWGYIALENDLNTIAGASFDHKGETPGLGAEIKDNKKFPASFKGKKLYTEAGDYVSVLVKKGGAEKGNVHQVDGISGATVTADGVTEMLYRGIRYYEPYLKSLKNN